MFAGNTEVAGCCTHREDDSACLVLDAVRNHRVHGSSGGVSGSVQADFLYQFHAELGAKAFSLAAHLLHELRAHDAFRKARVVFHFSGCHQRTTVFNTFKYDGLEFGTGGVHSCGVAGRTGTNNDDVADVGGVCHRDHAF